MELTHFNKDGRAHMVEVGGKEDSKRKAIAWGRIRMEHETIERIRKGTMKKGDVLSVAQIAGIMGAKKTSDLIPMCHNIFLTGANLKFNIIDDAIEVEAEVKTTGKTGVEMEALTAVSIACLTIYDMCKAMDKAMVIEDIKLMKKTGGKAGSYIRKEVIGRVLSVNISDEKEEVKNPIKEGLFKVDLGLEKDAHSGNDHRQISLLGIESFEKLEREGMEEFLPGEFAENITTEGVILHELPMGTKLVIGETIQEVTEVGRMNYVGSELSKKSDECILHKEGVFTKILKEGIIREGDIIEII